MRAITRERMALWKVGERFPIQDDMQRITLEVMLRVVFGLDDPEQRAAMREALLTFLAFALRPEAAVMWIPIAQVDFGPRSPWGRVKRTRGAVYDLILAAISERRRLGTEGRDDILSLLIAARDEDGQPMSDEELRDDLITLLLVGHETTAQTLTWAFWALLRRPEVLAKIREEHRAVMGAGGGGGWTAARLNELAYLGAAIKEVTRVHPVTDGAARLLKTPLRLGRYHLPAGVMVAASTWLTHHNPTYWPEPRRFLPERHLGPRPPLYSLVPFGGGQRLCLGASFATYEMKVILSEMLTGADLVVAPGYKPRVKRHAITVAAAGGVPVVLRRPVADPI
jgi:cytochrome P450